MMPYGMFVAMTGRLGNSKFPRRILQQLALSFQLDESCFLLTAES
jgi:hypothetical protein